MKLTINNLEWNKCENLANVYHCSENDRFALIVNGEIEAIGYLDEVLESVN